MTVHKMAGSLYTKDARVLVSVQEFSCVHDCVIGRLYSVQYKSIVGAPDKVRCNACDKARPLSLV
jgi:hypothetical protein